MEGPESETRAPAWTASPRPGPDPQDALRQVGRRGPGGGRALQQGCRHVQGEPECRPGRVHAHPSIRAAAGPRGTVPPHPQGACSLGNWEGRGPSCGTQGRPCLAGMDSSCPPGAQMSPWVPSLHVSLLMSPWTCSKTILFYTWPCGLWPSQQQRARKQQAPGREATPAAAGPPGSSAGRLHHHAQQSQQKREAQVGSQKGQSREGLESLGMRQGPGQSPAQPSGRATPTEGQLGGRGSPAGEVPGARPCVLRAPVRKWRVPHISWRRTQSSRCSQAGETPVRERERESRSGNLGAF